MFAGSVFFLTSALHRHQKVIFASYTLKYKIQSIQWWKTWLPGAHSCTSCDCNICSSADTELYVWGSSSQLRSRSENSPLSNQTDMLYLLFVVSKTCAKLYEALTWVKQKTCLMWRSQHFAGTPSAQTHWSSPSIFMLCSSSAPWPPHMCSTYR